MKHSRKITTTIVVVLVISTFSVEPATAQKIPHAGSATSPVSYNYGEGNQTNETVSVNRTAAPRLLEKNHNGSRVYVALSGTDEILIINSETDEVIKRISSYGDDPRDLKPVGPNQLLVANWGSENVALIDTKDEELQQNFSVGENPWAIKTTTTKTTGNIAVVASWSGEEEANGTITLINTTDFVIDGVIPIPSPNDGGPWGVATCPPPEPIYITNDGDDVTLKITLDPFAMEIVGKGELPWDAGCTPNPFGNGSILAIANGGLDSVGPSDDPVIQRLEVDESRTFIGWSEAFYHSLSPTGQKQVKSLQRASLPEAFRGSEEEDPLFKRVRKGEATLELVKINDRGQFKERIEIPVGKGRSNEPWGVSFDDAGNVYFTDMHSNNVFVVNGSTGEFVTNISTGEAPRDSVVANGKLYVSNSDTHGISTKGEPFVYTENITGPGSIDIIDLETEQKIKRITLGPTDELEPIGVFENPPTDPDDDGKFEDVNGDGDVNVGDVQALFANRLDPVVQNNIAAFDFNEDGDVNVGDVQALFANRLEV